MFGNNIWGLVILSICCFGCGILFFCLGAHAIGSSKPMGFWSQGEIKAHWVSDIPGYNLENARMWKLYSIPYFLSGFLACLSWVHEGYMIASVVVLMLAAFPGLFMLVRHYRKIEKKYITPKGLDKIDPFC